MASAAKNRDTYVPLSTRFSHGSSTISEWLDDKKLSRCTILKSTSDHINRPPSVLAKASIGFFISVIFLNPSDLSGSLTNALGLLPAAYHSFIHIKQLETPSTTPGLRKKENLIRKEKTKKWLDYWLIYGTTCTIENLAGENVLLGIIPFWWIFKSIWIIWFLVNLLDEGKENEIRPEPLRLRPRSVLASKDEPSDTSTTSSTISESPYPSSEEDEVSSEEDAGDKVKKVDDRSAVSYATSEASTEESPSPLSPAKLKAIRSELSQMDSPLLSAAPEIMRQNRAVTPITGISSDGDDTPDIKYSDSESSINDDSEPSDSDHSDSDDDVVVPAHTPLDELALRGKKTTRLPERDLAEYDSEDLSPLLDYEISDTEVKVEDDIKKSVDKKESSGNAGDLNEERPRNKEENEQEDKDKQAKASSPTDISKDPKISEQVSAANDEVHSPVKNGEVKDKEITEIPKQENPASPAKKPKSPSTGSENDEKPKSTSIDIVENKKPKSPSVNIENDKTPKLPEKKDDSREVVKLSMEDLLAMDKVSNAQDKHGIEEVEGRKPSGVAPLSIKKKSDKKVEK